MTSLVMATLLNASLLSATADTYAKAHREATDGKPLVVFVSTQWCPPCRQMKKTVLPEVRRRGLLEKVAFAVVDPDRNRKLAQKLTGGNQAVPQLIMYRRTAKGWRRSKLVGGQTADSVQRFIQTGIAPEQPAEKDVLRKDDPQPKPTAPGTQPVTRETDQ
ncbi:MAG: hypothetical protein A2V70_21255 [Planctomycetes bacterium RBG_13_63_9]|nr:MAG: hypothetical protein A2V70_21255 [Planctomycetes bacterium RBG_13_63_9]